MIISLLIRISSEKMSSMAYGSSCGSAMDSQSSTASGPILKPYLRRKKSSLGETKVAVIGMSGVGKSALSVRFLTKRFIGEYDQSAEKKYKCTTNIEGESITFELLDTRSTNNDYGARDDVLRWADGFMLVYSVTCRPSFLVVPDLRKKVDESKRASHVPAIVVGNKSDLEQCRQVTQDEGARIAAELGSSFVEVSASEEVSRVIDAFHTLCREIIEYKKRSRTLFDRVFGFKK